MKIVELNLERLKPYENNPRVNDRAAEMVAESIVRFGFRVPIVVDGDHNIVCGHTRWKAARKLAMVRVPCVIADDLTPEEAAAFRLVDNRTSELSFWDFAKLNDELAALAGMDLSPFGFPGVSGTSDLSGVFDPAENPSGTDGDSVKPAKKCFCPECGGEILC